MPILDAVRAFLIHRGSKPRCFRDIVKGARLYMGWRVWQIAQILNMSEASYKRFERGARDMQKAEVQKLDAALKTNGEFTDFWLGRIKPSFGKEKCSPMRAARLKNILTFSIACLYRAVNARATCLKNVSTSPRNGSKAGTA